MCHGTGIYPNTRDPNSYWDYWVIGGRWSGLFKALPSPVEEDGELHTNIARVRDLPNDLVPAAIVTPEGDWYAGPIVIRDELFEVHRDEDELRPRRDWDREAWALLRQHSDDFAVVVDCHS
jgi:hypothetical protein